MRHQMKGNRLGRHLKHLNAMLKNMSSSLFMQEVVKTTVPKARELRRFAEHTITRAKKGDFAGVRSRVFEEHVANKVMYDVAPRYATRQGGYTRMLKTGFRMGDTSEMAMVELVGRVGEIRPKGQKPVAPTPPEGTDARFWKPRFPVPPAWLKGV